MSHAILSKIKHKKASYTSLKVLGKGAFATVWLGTDRSKKYSVALKVVTKPGYFAAAKKEFDFMKQLTHPNIVRADAFLRSPSRATLVMSMPLVASCTPNSSLITAWMKPWHGSTSDTSLRE